MADDRRPKRALKRALNKLARHQNRERMTDAEAAAFIRHKTKQLLKKMP